MDTPEPIPFTGLVQESAGLLAASLTNHGVKLTVGEDLPVVSGDRQRLLQVMTNLLENAAKFMGSQEEPRIEISAYQEDESVLVCIQDNGIGIAPEYLDKVFSVFTRLDPSVPGTGFGRALVWQIIEAHGGKIRVESE